jgi:preprotein translocase subunit Sec63
VHQVSFYEILGVGPNATIVDLGAAFRRESRKYHPQSHSKLQHIPESDRAEMMGLLSQAKEILQDTRDSYNDLLRTGGGLYEIPNGITLPPAVIDSLPATPAPVAPFFVCKSTELSAVC